MASLLDQGRVVLQLHAADCGEAEFNDLVGQLARHLAGTRPRVVVTYQEGLLGAVHAEQALDLVFIEDDPHDTPPVQIRRRTVAAEPEAVAAALALAERRAGQRGVG